MTQLRAQIFKQGNLSNRQKKNAWFFQQLLQQNVSSFLS